MSYPSCPWWSLNIHSYKLAFFTQQNRQTCSGQTRSCMEYLACMEVPSTDKGHETVLVWCIWNVNGQVCASLAWAKVHTMWSPQHLILLLQGVRVATVIRSNQARPETVWWDTHHISHKHHCIWHPLPIHIISWLQSSARRMLGTSVIALLVLMLCNVWLSNGVSC